MFCICIPSSSRNATRNNLGIYASVVERYKLSVRISRHQYFFNQQK